MLWIVDYLWAHELYLPIRIIIPFPQHLYPTKLSQLSYFLVRIYNATNLIFLSFTRFITTILDWICAQKVWNKNTLNISDLSKNFKQHKTFS